MFEFMGLIGGIFLLGLVGLATFIIILPFYLLLRVMGFALKVGLAGIFVAFFGILLFPLFLVVGALLFFKLLIIGLPLLIAIVLFSWLAGFFRRDDQRPIIVQTVPPAST